MQPIQREEATQMPADIIVAAALTVVVDEVLQDGVAHITLNCEQEGHMFSESLADLCQISQLTLSIQK